MTRARWVVFAYHTFGARALGALLARGEHVAAVVTHPDDPAEGDWFEIVPSGGITVTTSEGLLLVTRVQSASGVEESADPWAVRRGLRPGMRL